MLKVQKFSLFQRCGMDSGQSQWWIVSSSQRDLALESAIWRKFRNQLNTLSFTARESLKLRWWDMVWQYFTKTFHLMAWLPGLQTGRGEPMSVISDKEVRGDLILNRVISKQCLPPPSFWKLFQEQVTTTAKLWTCKSFYIIHLSFLLAFILALSKVRGFSLMQQFEGDGGATCCCCNEDAGEGMGGGGIDVSQCWGKPNVTCFSGLGYNNIYFAARYIG